MVTITFITCTKCSNSTLLLFYYPTEMVLSCLGLLLHGHHIQGLPSVAKNANSVRSGSGLKKRGTPATVEVLKHSSDLGLKPRHLGQAFLVAFIIRTP